MKKILCFLLPVLILFACNNDKNIPDVSGIKLEIPVERFEESFFAIDSNNIAAGLASLQQKHPDFYTDFMKQILGVSGDSNDTTTQMVTRSFLSNYYPIYDSLKSRYSNIDWLKKELEQAYRFVKHYFPDYKTGKAITFIGTFDMPGTALTKTGIAIGLHQYAGKDFSVYQSTVGQQLYPTYISRRFEPQYITTNCMKAVVDELYPDKSGSRGLIEQMIEKGKQWWLLDKFLPTTPDSIKTGYTQSQLEFCKRNEGLIWQNIITNEKNLHTIEPVAIQTYVGEAPFTPNMPEASPGNIGQWVGWQIVKKYVEKNPSFTINEIMKTDPNKILEEAKYKPK